MPSLCLRAVLSLNGSQGSHPEVFRPPHHASDEYEDNEMGKALFKLGVRVEGGLGPDGTYG